MKTLVTGSSGFLGSALLPRLRSEGHTVTRLVRRPTGDGEAAISWDPEAGRAPAPQSLEGFEAVVHLAGENIARRWTENQKARVRASRVRGTALLAEAAATLSRPPRAMVCASAIGYYGDRGDEILREESAAGAGFLPEVCREWEAAAKPAVAKGIRVVHLRIGIVLSPKGGALAKMLPPFKMGAGGKVGSGRQFMSWIALDDLLGIILFSLAQDSLRGPVNAVAPNPVTNLDFTKTLGRVLGRPALFPLPAFAVRVMFGEMGEQLLLASQRVEPARLLNAGFRFQFAELEPALRHALGKV